MTVIRLADVPETAETGVHMDDLVMKKAIGSGSKDPAYIGAEVESISVTHIKIWGRLRRMVCDDSDRVMFILDGEGVAQVGDDPVTHFGAGDFILIRRGTQYEACGVFTYLVMNSPAYREGSDVREF